MLDTQELTAEDIFAADDLTISDPIEIPEWKKNGKPGLIYFRVMSADKAIEYGEIFNSDAKKNAFVRIIQECACNSKGELLFTAKQLGELKKKNSAIFLRLQKYLMQLNGLVPPTKTWEALRAILKNAGVDASVISVVETKWNEDDTLKNDSREAATVA